MGRHHGPKFIDKQLVERQCSFLQHLLLIVGFSRFSCQEATNIMHAPTDCSTSNCFCSERESIID